MIINDMNNLWVGFNETENFTVLICALDAEEAKEIADNYCLDSHLKGEFKISEYTKIDTCFDCDYVLTH